MKKIILAVASIALAVALASCGSAPAPVEVEDTMSDADIAKALTATYFTGVELNTFGYGDHAKSVTEVVAVAKTPVLNCMLDTNFQALAKKGYKIYAVGHACKYGSKGANKMMGLKRAKQINYELRAQGLDYKLLGAKSIGDAKMKEGVDAGAPAQRRVTFEVAKK